MSGGFNRCGTNDLRCPNASRKWFLVDDAWTCPHGRSDCRLKLEPVSWRKRNPLLYSLIFRILPVAALLGATAWFFWPNFLLRRADDLHRRAGMLVSAGGNDGRASGRLADLEGKAASIGPADDAVESTTSLLKNIRSFAKELEGSKAEDPGVLVGKIHSLESEASNIESEASRTGNSMVLSSVRDTRQLLSKASAASSSSQSGGRELGARVAALSSVAERLTSLAALWKKTVDVTGVRNLPRDASNEISSIRQEIMKAAGGVDEIRVLDNGDARLDILGKPSVPLQPDQVSKWGAELSGQVAVVPPSPPNRLPEFLDAAGNNLKIADLRLLIASRRQAIAEAWRDAPVLLSLAATSDLADKLAAPLISAYVKQRFKTDSSLVARSPSEIRLGFLLNGQKNVIVIHRTDDSGIYDSLAAGVDINFAARLPSESETSKNPALKSPECAEVVALDALAVLAPSGSESNLIKASEIGARYRLLPSPSSGDSWLEPSIRMYGIDKGSVEPKKITPLLMDTNFRDSSSIGIGSYSSYSRSPAGKTLLSVQADEDTAALAPSPFTISTEDYKYSVRILSFHPEKPRNADVLEFFRFAASPAAYPVVASAGFVDLNPRMGDDKPYPPIPLDARRLSPSIRFEFGKSDLDLKARDDLERIVRRLSEPDLQKQTVYLAGHTDNVGDDAVNDRLSKERAAQVESELSRRGIKRVHSIGFGKKYPVDTNSSETGRQKNRRVEIWVSPSSGITL